MHAPDFDLGKTRQPIFDRAAKGFLQNDRNTGV